MVYVVLRPIFLHHVTLMKGSKATGVRNVPIFIRRGLQEIRVFRYLRAVVCHGKFRRDNCLNNQVIRAYFSNLWLQELSRELVPLSVRRSVGLSSCFYADFLATINTTFVFNKDRCRLSSRYFCYNFGALVIHDRMYVIRSSYRLLMCSLCRNFSAWRHR